LQYTAAERGHKFFPCFNITASLSPAFHYVAKQHARNSVAEILSAALVSKWKKIKTKCRSNHLQNSIPTIPEGFPSRNFSVPAEKPGVTADIW